MNKTHIVIHHSLTKDGETLSAEAIRRYHVEVNGWDDIGYQYVFESFEGSPICVAGRPILARAAAAYQQGMNVKGVHACFVGNFDETTPGDEILSYASAHLADVCSILGIQPSATTVIPHSLVAKYKTCPGNLFPMTRFIEMIAARAKRWL